MNIRKTRVRFLHIMLFIILAPVLSCRLDVPVKEMSLARMNITRSYEVKADKFAADDLKLAQEHLYKSHEAIRNDDAKKAKEEAELSLKSSNEAIKKSLPLLARDSLDEAKGVRKEAEDLNAEKFAPEEFAQADQNIKEADDLFGKGQYWDAHLKAKDGLKSANDAKARALANVPAMKQEIARIEGELGSLKANKGDAFAPEEIKASESNLGEAKTSLDAGNLKLASTRIGEADEALKKATGKAQKGIASDKIETAENALKKAEESDIKKYYADDLAKVKALIGQSRDFNQKESYKESIAKSDEAIGILNSLTIAMEKKSEEARLDKDRKRALKGLPAEGDIPKEYTVKLNPKKRDCLWRIAAYTYKNARLWPLIYMANKDKIKDPDLIFPGQKFAIPPVPKRGEKKDEAKDKIKDSVEKKKKDEEKPKDEEKIETPKDDTGDKKGETGIDMIK